MPLEKMEASKYFNNPSLFPTASALPPHLVCFISFAKGTSVKVIIRESMRGRVTALTSHLFHSYARGVNEERKLFGLMASKAGNGSCISREPEPKAKC